MNEEQLGRIVLFLKIIGYAVSGGITWFYITKGIVSLLPNEMVLTVERTGASFALIGFFWPLAVLFIANIFCHLITWIVNGKSHSLLGKEW